MAIKAQFSITLSRVDDGQKGEPGAAGVGVKLSVVTYQASTSGTSTPTGTWLSSIPAVDAGSYLWTRTITTMTDGTSSTAYSVALQGKTGPQGPKGSDITSYDSGLALPSTVAPANSQFWLVDTNNIAIKFYKSTGSAWVEQQISASAINAATFNGLSFNGVTFNGSTFNSTFSNVQPGGATFTVHGTSTLEHGALSTLAYKDSDNSLYSATGVSPVDISSVLYDSGTKFDEIRLKEGQLYLGGLYKETASSDAVWKSGVITPMQLLMMQRCGLVLWSGVSSMNGSQSITPSLKLNECLNGWLLNWSGYNVDTQTVNNGQMSYTLIPKSHIGYGGAATANYIYTAGAAGQKYIYASNTTLSGNNVNTSANPQKSIVLRAVYAF